MRISSAVSFGVAIACAACGKGGARDVATACDDELVRIAGACVGPDDARAYCGGPIANGACAAFATCDEHEALDVRSGACVPTLGTRAMAARGGLTMTEEEAPACHDDQRLVATGGELTCLPPSVLGPRSTEWKDVRAPLVGDAHLVDVGLWARGALGSSGGPGSPLLCGALARDPVRVGVRPGTTATVPLLIALTFPNNDVRAASAEVEGPVAANEAVFTLISALRALGGHSNAANVTLRVACEVSGGAPPLALTKKRQ